MTVFLNENFPASIKTLLLVALGVITGGYLIYWIVTIVRDRVNEPGVASSGDRLTDSAITPGPLHLAIGFIANFFDTLSISSFATTTAMFKFTKLVPDRVIPGTLNVGHLLPTVAQAFLFMELVKVDPQTLVLLILAAIAGAWLGSGFVVNWSKRKIQIGMGVALLIASVLMTMKQFKMFEYDTGALGVSGTRLLIGVLGNFVFGALMTLGIGLYAPCMIMVSLLGMNPKAAFPIMMGSCAFLMPACSARFIRQKSYDLRAAIGLSIGGLPAVFLAAPLIDRLPIEALRWMVVVVVLYTAVVMLRSAFTELPSSTNNESQVAIGDRSEQI